MTTSHIVDETWTVIMNIAINKEASWRTCVPDLLKMTKEKNKLKMECLCLKLQQEEKWHLARRALMLYGICKLHLYQTEDTLRSAQSFHYRWLPLLCKEGTDQFPTGPYSSLIEPSQDFDFPLEADLTVHIPDSDSSLIAEESDITIPEQRMDSSEINLQSGRQCEEWALHDPSMKKRKRRGTRSKEMTKLRSKIRRDVQFFSEYLNLSEQQRMSLEGNEDQVNYQRCTEADAADIRKTLSTVQVATSFEDLSNIFRKTSYFYRFVPYRYLQSHAAINTRKATQKRLKMYQKYIQDEEQQGARCVADQENDTLDIEPAQTEAHYIRRTRDPPRKRKLRFKLDKKIEFSRKELCWSGHLSDAPFINIKGRHNRFIWRKKRLSDMPFELLFDQPLSYILDYPSLAKQISQHWKRRELKAPSIEIHGKQSSRKKKRNKIGISERDNRLLDEYAKNEVQFSDPDEQQDDVANPEITLAVVREILNETNQKKVDFETIMERKGSGQRKHVTNTFYDLLCLKQNNHVELNQTRWHGKLSIELAKPL